MYSIIAGTGSYIPKKRIKNEYYTPQGEKFHKTIEETVNKFEDITNIKVRRYVTGDLVTSDIAYFTAVDV